MCTGWSWSPGPGGPPWWQMENVGVEEQRQELAPKGEELQEGPKHQALWLAAQPLGLPQSGQGASRQFPRAGMKLHLHSVMLLCSFYLLLFFSVFETGSGYVAQAGLKFSILLPQCWDDRAGATTSGICKAPVRGIFTNCLHIHLCICTIFLLKRGGQARQPWCRQTTVR
jgi:hypothetical protein